MNDTTDTLQAVDLPHIVRPVFWIVWTTNMQPCGGFITHFLNEKTGKTWCGRKCADGMFGTSDQFTAGCSQCRRAVERRWPNTEAVAAAVRKPTNLKGD